MHSVCWIEANGISLRYRIDGNGERVVVLLHEMGGTLDSWDYVIPFLSSRYRVVRYDLRGFGLSEKIHGAFSIEDAVDDLKALLDTLEIREPLAVIGSAVGGGVALRYAAAWPRRVKALIVMAPATEVPEERREFSKTLGARMRALGVRGMLETFVIPTAFPKEITRDKERFWRFQASQRSVDITSCEAVNDMLLTSLFAPYFRAIECPTLVVAGTYDRARSPEALARVASAIPGGRLQVIASGHFMALQTPELVGETIMDFLSEAWL